MPVLPAWKGANIVWCRLAWLATLAVLLVGGRWASAASLESLLLQWQQMQERTSYHGSFVYERKGVFSTHEVWRQAKADGESRERFMRLNGNRLEALRINGRLACMARSRQEQGLNAEQEPVLPVNRFDPLRMDAGYHVEQVGRGRVADRDVAILLFTPRDIHRYPLEVHFDLETGVVLKSLLLNEQAELLERFQFVSFQAGAQAEEQLRVEGCEAVAVEAGPELAGGPGWLAGWVPDGFVPGAEAPVRQGGISSQLFFDGLAHFSIFVAAIEAGMTDMEHHQLGPTVVISRPVEKDEQQYMITVLGEIPAATAHRIALSVTLDEVAGDD